MKSKGESMWKVIRCYGCGNDFAVNRWIAQSSWGVVTDALNPSGSLLKCPFCGKDGCLRVVGEVVVFGGGGDE